MAEFKIEIPLAPLMTDIATITREFNGPSVAPDAAASRAFLFLRDESNQIRGGAHLEFIYDLCSVVGIWVAPEIRNQGYGARLYRAAEDLAYIKKRKRMVLSVFELYGVKPFWEKQGFAVYAELPGCSVGNRLFYMHKDVLEKPFSSAGK